MITQIPNKWLNRECIILGYDNQFLSGVSNIKRWYNNQEYYIAVKTKTMIQNRPLILYFDNLESIEEMYDDFKKLYVNGEKYVPEKYYSIIKP